MEIYTVMLPFVFVLAVQLFTSTTIYAQQPTTPNVLICYYNSISYFREGMPFQPSNIDPSLCTHIIYSGMGMREDNHNVYSRNPGLDYRPGEFEPFPNDPENAEGDLDMIRKTVKLRDENPNLKVLASIGGPQQTSRSFSTMSRHIANRTLFIRSAMKFVDLFELDGASIDWKDVGLNGGRPEDIETFVILMQELRAAFTNLTAFTGRQYTLTAAVGCTKDVIDVGYDVNGLTEQVDFLHMFCFDFKMFETTGENISHHSPLHHKESEHILDQQLTVAFGVNYFLQLGAGVSRKLVLGLSTHAITYELGAPDFNNFYQRSLGPGSPGSFTRQPGVLAYFEICDEIKKSSSAFHFRFDHEYHVPFMHNDSLWIGYDNEISAKEKVDFAMANNLGGMMVEFIDFDDYNNLCEGWVSFPLTSAIKDRLIYWENKRNFV